MQHAWRLHACQRSSNLAHWRHRLTAGATAMWDGRQTVPDLNMYTFWLEIPQIHRNWAGFSGLRNYSWVIHFCFPMEFPKLRHMELAAMPIPLVLILQIELRLDLHWGCFYLAFWNAENKSFILLVGYLVRSMLLYRRDLLVMVHHHHHHHHHHHPMHGLLHTVVVLLLLLLLLLQVVYIIMRILFQVRGFKFWVAFSTSELFLSFCRIFDAPKPNLSIYMKRIWIRICNVGSLMPQNPTYPFIFIWIWYVKLAGQDTHLPHLAIYPTSWPICTPACFWMSWSTGPNGIWMIAL